jgi:hypothetical protein
MADARFSHSGAMIAQGRRRPRIGTRRMPLLVDALSSNDQELGMVDDARDTREGCELHRRGTAKTISIIE